MLRVHILIERTVAQLDFHSDPFFGPQSGSLLIKRYHGFLLVDGKGRPHLRPVILPMQLVKTIQSLAQQMKTQQVLESDRPVRIVHCQPFPHFQQICRHGILSALFPTPCLFPPNDGSSSTRSSRYRYFRHSAAHSL